MEKMRINQSILNNNRRQVFKTNTTISSGISDIITRLVGRMKKRKRESLSVAALQSTRKEQKAYSENNVYYQNDTYRRII